MIEHYRMFPVNLSLFILLIASLLLFKFFKPRKKINLIIPLIVLSILPVISNFRIGVFESGQFREHVVTSMSFFNSLSDGNFFPRWTAIACSGYGCPLFNFQYLSIYYLASFFHAIGFSFIMSMKITMSFAYVLSGITMYLYVKKELNEKSAFLASTFYLFAPFHLGSMHFRGSVAELLSFAVIPITFYFLHDVFTKKGFVPIFGFAFSVYLLVLTHQAVFFSMIPIILVMIILNYNRYTSLANARRITIGLTAGILLSSYRWLPILFEKEYIHFIGTEGVEFQKVWFYLFSPLNNQFGLLFQGNSGELYPNIGYFHIIAFVVSIYLLLKHKIGNKFILYVYALLIMIVLYFIMMLEISRPIWLSIPFIIYIQNAWRLVIPLAFLTSILAGIISYKTISTKLIIIICFLLVATTILNWGNRSLDTRLDDNNLSTSPYFKERNDYFELPTPIWVDTNASWIGNRKSNVISLDGKAQIVEVARKTELHEYLINSPRKSILLENTYFYPGWKLYINNKPKPINHKLNGYKGLMAFEVPSGQSKVVFKFEETPIRMYGNTVSLTTFLLLSFAFCLKITKKLNHL